MRKIYKISAILLISLTMVITSCKEDEQIIEGCIDSSAINYLSNATSNNGSCIYAYDIAKGTWYFDFNCGDIDPSLLGITLPNSVNVKSEGDGVLIFEFSVLNEAIEVNGTINNNGEIDIPEQSIDIASIPAPVIVKGDGFIESQDSGNLTLEYSVPLLPNLSCYTDLRREE